MAGITRTLTFSEGVSVSAPSQTFLQTNSLQTAVNDAGFVTDKGSAAADGDIYLNTTDNVVRAYINGSWQTVLDDSGIGSPITITDTTNATTKDTGCLILEGGLGVEQDVHIGGNLFVTGTSSSIADLVVTDENIIVNSGGNQATADSGDAGLVVDMSDATNTTIHYDSTATSRFKLGDVGSTVEIADISSSQVLTNKDIDGGTASNTSRVTVPKNTKTNLDGLTRKEATIVYGTDTKKAYVDDGTTLNEIGSGGGGLDVFHTQDFEVFSAVNASGNNASFLGGGTLDGAFALDTSTEIAGSQSGQYTASTASTNDYLEIETIDLDLKQRATDIKFRFIADMSGFANDVTFVVYDKTNGAVLTDSLDVLTASKARSFYEFAVYVPSTCAQISYGFHMVAGATNTEVFKFDDVEVSTNPFSYRNLIEEQFITHTANVSTLTNATAETEFNISNVSSSGDNILTVADDSGNTRTTFTANSACTVSVKFSARLTNSGQQLHIYKNGSIIDYGDMSYAANARSEISATISLAADDILTVGAPSAQTLSAVVDESAALYIHAMREAEHVITPAKSTVSDWISYTPTTQGFGTIASVECYYRRVGDSVEISAKFTTGTVTASEAQIGLPSVDGVQLTVASTEVPSVKQAGVYFRNTASASNGGAVLITSGDSFVNISENSVFGTAAVNPITPTTGTNAFVTGEICSLICTVPVEQWNSDATFLAAVPVQRTAYLKDVKSSGTSGGTFTSGAWQTRDLNTVEGDSEIVSLSTNQFTLGSGKYVIEATAPAYQVELHKAKLRNITDSSDDIIGTSERSDGAVTNVTESKVVGEVEITTSKTFELQHRCSTTVSISGYGDNNGFGVSEIYSQVKITKIK